jgi:hypothetical protein
MLPAFFERRHLTMHLWEPQSHILHKNLWVWLFNNSNQSQVVHVYFGVMSILQCVLRTATVGMIGTSKTKLTVVNTRLENHFHKGSTFENLRKIITILVLYVLINFACIRTALSFNRHKFSKIFCFLFDQ